MSTQGDLIGGRYRLQAAVSDRTWRALDETTGTHVVLRDVSGADDADLERIAADARTPALTAHPATIAVLDYVVGDAGAWLVTEYVPGRTLSSAIAEWGPLPLPQVATIAAGVLAAVVAEGRDRAVRPEDILLADDGRVLVGGVAGAEPASAGSLASVAAVVVFAAEGRSVFEDTTGVTALTTRPELTELLDALTATGGNRVALGRAWTELGRLGIEPPDPDRTQPITATDLGDSVAESAVAAVVEEFRTQPPRAADAVDPDATRPMTAADLEDSGVGGLPTTAMTAAELADALADSAVDPNATRPITAADLEDSGFVGLSTEPMTAAELADALADSAVDPNVTRPISAADLEDSAVGGLSTAPMTADELADALADSAVDPNVTRPISAADLLAGSLADSDTTEPLRASGLVDSASGSNWARPITAADLAGPDPDEESVQFVQPVQPVQDAAPDDPNLTRPLSAADADFTRPLSAADLARAAADPLATRPITAADLIAPADTGIGRSGTGSSTSTSAPVDPEATSAIDMSAFATPPAQFAPDQPPQNTRELPVQDTVPPPAPHRTQVMPTTDHMTTIPVPSNLGQAPSGEEHTLPEPIPMLTQAVPPESGQWTPGRNAPGQGYPAQPPSYQGQPPAFPGQYPPPHEQRPDLVPPGRPVADAVPPTAQAQAQMPPAGQAHASFAPPTMAGSPVGPPDSPWGQPGQQGQPGPGGPNNAWGPPAQPGPSGTTPWGPQTQNPGPGTSPWGPQAPAGPGPGQAWQGAPNQPNFAFGQPPQPFFPPQPPPQPPKKNRTVGIAVIAIVVVAAIVAGIVLLTHKKSTSDHVANTGETSAPVGVSASFPSLTVPKTTKSTPSATGTSDDGTSPTSDATTDGGSADGTALDDQGTDQTPFDPSSFFPDSFTDAQGTQYTRRASGPGQCQQDTASSTMNNILSSNGCLQMDNASYVDTDNKILISVVTYAFPDKDSASKAFEAIQAKHGVDMGLWCPESGVGSSPCQASSSKYHAASSYEWYQQDHRYLTTAVAVYINLSTDTSLQTQESAASKKAVYACGPQYYLSQNG